MIHRFIVTVDTDQTDEETLQQFLGLIGQFRHKSGAAGKCVGECHITQFMSTTCFELYVGRYIETAIEMALDSEKDAKEDNDDRYTLKHKKGLRFKTGVHHQWVTELRSARKAELVVALQGIRDIDPAGVEVGDYIIEDPEKFTITQQMIRDMAVEQMQWASSDGDIEEDLLSTIDRAMEQRKPEFDAKGWK